jgi:hypothetical protein
MLTRHFITALVPTGSSTLSTILRSPAYLPDRRALALAVKRAQNPVILKAAREEADDAMHQAPLSVTSKASTPRPATSTTIWSRSLPLAESGYGKPSALRATRRRAQSPGKRHSRPREHLQDGKGRPRARHRLSTDRQGKVCGTGEARLTLTPQRTLMEC